MGIIGTNPGLVDEAGNDYIVSNTRVRASKNFQTFTDSTGSVTLTPNYLGVNYIDGAGTPFVITTGAAQTLAASQILTGVCVYKISAGVTLTTDTAANILAAANAVTSGVAVGDYISCLIMNDASGAFALTMAMGSGVTSANTTTNSIPQNTSRYCLFRFTNVTAGSAAVTMYF